MKKRIAIENADDVVKFFLAKKDLTQKQIHKLLFFSYLEYLQQNNDNDKSLNNVLFENKFQAWIHGPVYETLYKTYADYGSSLIGLNFESMESEESIAKKFSEEVVFFLNKIFEKYQGLDGNELEELSHKTLAWRVAREGYSSQEICTELIKDIDIYNTAKIKIGV